MMERDFIIQKTKEWHIKKYIEKRLKRVELSKIKLKKIPLGEKIIINTSRPSLVVGSKGVNIRDLTKELKKHFKLENPQIEIIEVKDVFLDPQVVADRIVSLLERYGSQRFKSIGHRMMENIMRSGALGVEIIISGKIPGARAKNWRFYQGYLKKCGDVAITGVKSAQKVARLKSGIIGIKVKIMPPDITLPDAIEIKEPIVEDATEESKETTKEEKTEKKAEKKTTKKTDEKEDKKEATEDEVKAEAQDEDLAPEEPEEEPITEEEALAAEEKDQIKEEP